MKERNFKVEFYIWSNIKKKGKTETFLDLQDLNIFYVLEKKKKAQKAIKEHNLPKQEYNKNIGRCDKIS